jgi:hypothetical protein
LTFRGYGPIDTQGTKSAAMRETRVQVAPSHQCVDKFDLDIVRRDNGNAGGEDQGGDSRASTSVAQRLSVKSTKSLNFKDRQLCVGNNGLTQYGVTGGCPNGDVGGPLETDDGVLVGLFSRLTPAVPLVDVNHNANEVGADNLDPTHPSRNEEPSNDCGGAGRGRYYDVFTRISYYRGWIQRVVEERYDGGVCSVSRLLDSPLRCPAGSWGDSEGHDPLLGLIGGGGPLSSLGTSSVDTTAASSNNVVDSGAPLEAPYLTIHTHPSISTSARCKQCPPGRYGAVEGLETSDCSGMCEEGFWCPSGSVTPYAQACATPTTHCPRGTRYVNACA